MTFSRVIDSSHEQSRTIFSHSSPSRDFSLIQMPIKSNPSNNPSFQHILEAVPNSLSHSSIDVYFWQVIAEEDIKHYKFISRKVFSFLWYSTMLFLLVVFNVKLNNEKHVVLIRVASIAELSFSFVLLLKTLCDCDLFLIKREIKKKYTVNIECGVVSKWIAKIKHRKQLAKNVQKIVLIFKILILLTLSVSSLIYVHINDAMNKSNNVTVKIFFIFHFIVPYLIVISTIFFSILILLASCAYFILRRNIFAFLSVKSCISKTHFQRSNAKPCHQTPNQEQVQSKESSNTFQSEQTINTRKELSQKERMKLFLRNTKSLLFFTLQFMSLSIIFYAIVTIFFIYITNLSVFLEKCKL